MECEVWSERCGVEARVRGVECEVWSVRCGV